MVLPLLVRACEALGSHAAEERDAAGLVAALEAKTTLMHRVRSLLCSSVLLFEKFRLQDMSRPVLKANEACPSAW